MSTTLGTFAESEAYAHPLSDFSGDLAPHGCDDSRSLSQPCGLIACVPSLTCGINLAYVDGFVCVQFFVIVLFYSATGFRCSVPVAADGFTRAGIDSSDLFSGLLVNGHLYVGLVLLAA